MTRAADIDDEEILRLWDEGNSMNVISKKLHIGNHTVKKRLVKMEVDTARSYPSWSDEQDLRLIIGRNSGRTGKDLYSSVPGKTNAGCMHRLTILRRDGRVR